MAGARGRDCGAGAGGGSGEAAQVAPCGRKQARGTGKAEAGEAEAGEETEAVEGGRIAARAITQE